MCEHRRRMRQGLSKSTRVGSLRPAHRAPRPSPSWMQGTCPLQSARLRKRQALYALCLFAACTAHPGRTAVHWQPLLIPCCETLLAGTWSAPQHTWVLVTRLAGCYQVRAQSFGSITGEVTSCASRFLKYQQAHPTCYAAVQRACSGAHSELCACSAGMPWRRAAS